MDCKNNTKIVIIYSLLLLFLFLEIYYYINLISPKNVTDKQIDSSFTTYGTINFDGQNTGYIDRFSTFKNNNISSNGKSLTNSSSCIENNGFWNIENNKCLCYAPFSGDKCQNQEYNNDFYKIYAKIYYDDGTQLNPSLNKGLYPGIDGNENTKSMLNYTFSGRYSWYTILPNGELYPLKDNVSTPSKYCVDNPSTKGFYVINNITCYILFGIYMIEILPIPDERYVLFIKKSKQYDFVVKDKIYAIPDPEYTGNNLLPKPYFEYENTEIECDFLNDALDPIYSINKKLKEEITTKKLTCFFPNPMIILNGKLNFHDGSVCPISTSQYPFGISDVYQCKHDPSLNPNKDNFPINDYAGNVSWLYTKPTKPCSRTQKVKCSDQSSNLCDSLQCNNNNINDVNWLTNQCCKTCNDNDKCWPRPDKEDRGENIFGEQWSCYSKPCCSEGDYLRTKQGCLYCLQTYVTSIYNVQNGNAVEDKNLHLCRDLVPRSNVSYFVNKNTNAYSQYLSSTELSKIDYFSWQIYTYQSTDISEGVNKCCRGTNREEELGTVPVSTVNPCLLYNNPNGFRYYQGFATERNANYDGGFNYGADPLLNKYDPKYTSFSSTYDSVAFQPIRNLKTMSLNNAYTNKDFVGDMNYYYIVNTLKNKDSKPSKATYSNDKLDNYRIFGNMYFKGRDNKFEPYTLNQSYYDVNEYTLGYDYIYTNYFRPRGLDTYSESIGNYFETYYTSIFYKSKIPSSIKIKLPEYTYIVNKYSMFNMDPKYSANINKKYPEIYKNAMDTDTGYDFNFVKDMIYNLKFPPNIQYYQSINFTIPCSTRCSFPYIMSSSINGFHASEINNNCCQYINNSLYPRNNKRNPQNVC